MGKYLLICQRCGAEFSSYKSYSKYCSRDCFRASQSRYSVIRVCEHCGKAYSTRYDNQQFCSVECRSASTKKRIECACDNCGVLIERKPAEYNKHKHHFCSTQCKQDYYGWNEDDEKILAEYFGRKNVADIIPLLSEPHTIGGTRDKAKRMGFSALTFWSEEERAILVNNYSTIPMKEVMKLLPGRTLESIKTQAKLRNLKSYHTINKIYSPDEIKFIHTNCETMYLEDIASKLNRSAYGVKQKMSALGVPCIVKDKRHYFGSDGGLRKYVRNHQNGWREKKFKELNGVCCLTGSKEDLVVHHCYGFSLIFEEAIEVLGFEIKGAFDDYTKDSLDKFLDVFRQIQDVNDECACVTKSIHLLFHREYGFGDNTPEQWNEFVEKFKAGQYADIA